MEALFLNWQLIRCYCDPLPRAATFTAVKGDEAASTFDDVVEWRMRAQFHDLMTSAGVFPAEPLP